jgi:heme/copper-type cytochrome/quinol oxidase subunit 4
MNPLRILKEAIKSNPSLKYALGVLGIAAVVVIIKTWNIENTKLPVITFLALFGFMILLLIFSSISKSKDPHLKFAGYVLVYAVIIILCVSAVLILSALMFDWPLPLSKLLK